MQTLLDVINSGDVFSLIVLIVVLCWLGSWMIDRRPQLRQWGKRLAAGAFISYCVIIGSELEAHTPQTWLGIVWRGLLTAGLTLGASWVVLAVYGFLQAMSDSASAKAQVRATQRQWEKQRKQREKAERKRKQEWDRQAPERERQRKLADEQRCQAQALQTETQQQRDDTRLACELFYNLHAPTIGERFSKQDLHEFLDRYMGDHQSLDVLRRRATQLTETIRQHVDAVDPPEDLDSLEKLTAWFAKQKSGIESLGLDDDFKDMFINDLNEQYASRCHRMLEEAQG